MASAVKRCISESKPVPLRSLRGNGATAAISQRCQQTQPDCLATLEMTQHQV